MQKLPIGKSDFQSIIEDGFYYIDKTLIIQEIIQSSADVLLLPRPRRFGKTLALSTLYYFFENQQKNHHLFKQLAIYKEPEFSEHFGQYPVIYLTFKDIKEKDFKTSLEKIYYLIDGIFSKYERIIDHSIDKLVSSDRKQYQRIMSNTASQVDYENALKLLSKILTTIFNKKCIVLIDEYDTPIQIGFVKGYYDEIIEFFKTFLGAVLKDNDKYFYKAIITGILSVSKESIFSDLNNIDIFTLLDKQFSDKFGFTTKEVKNILTAFNLIENFEEINQWYNGYKIGQTIIFNPWSILNYTNRRELGVFWENTSSNEIIKTLVENSSSFRKDLEILLHHHSVEKVIDPNITFKDKNFNFDEETLYSFLFFSGYLRCDHKKMVLGEYWCQLSLVNIESYYIFRKIISKWINASFVNYKLRIMLKSLIKADLKLFEKIFSEFVRDTLSYFDTSKKIESVYHAFLLGLLVNLNDYEVISNQESDYGRFDIMLLHKIDKIKPAIIMELKTIDEFEEETKETALESAVKQIEEKQYEAKAIQKGYSNIIKFGLVFHGKRVWIKQSI